MGTARCGEWCAVSSSSPRRPPPFYRRSTDHTPKRRFDFFFSPFPPCGRYSVGVCGRAGWVADGVGAPLGEEPGRVRTPTARFRAGAQAVVSHRRLFSFAVPACVSQSGGCVHAERRPGLRCPALSWHGMGADAALCFGAGFMARIEMVVTGRGKTGICRRLRSFLFFEHCLRSFNVRMQIVCLTVLCVSKDFFFCGFLVRIAYAFCSKVRF